jgi:hypothetical protein
MVRRTAIVLVVWLGLLWAASPAFACARGGHGDCCPDGMTSPCKGAGSGIDLSTLCCVSVPAASPATLAATSQANHIQPHDSGSSDPIVALAWFATVAPSIRAAPSADRRVSIVRTEASLTYLRTRRLRL